MKSRPLSTFHCGHVGCGSMHKQCFTPLFATKRVLYQKNTSVTPRAAEKSSGVGEVDAVKSNLTIKSATVEFALSSAPTSDDESLPSDSDSENEISLLNSPAVKIIDPFIGNTTRLDLMEEYWSKFCQSDKQLEEMLCNNTITGEIVDIIGIFVVLKSGVVFKSGCKDFSAELSTDQLEKCLEPCKGSFFANSPRGLELINLTEHGKTFTLEMASRWEPSKTFRSLEELKKYLKAEKMELYFAEKRFKKYNFPRFVLINPFTLFKPDDTMMEMIKNVLPVALDKKNIPLWKATKVESDVSFNVQEFNDLPIECNFIANLDVSPVSENPALSIQYCLAMDEIYITNLLEGISLEAKSSHLLANDAAIEYSNVSGMKNHLAGRVQ